MQHGEEADLGAEVPRVGGDRAERLGGGGELCGQREDEVKVRAGEKLRVTRFDPLGTGKRLALRAMPVAATVVADAPVSARIAGLDVPAECGAAAGGECVQDAPLGAGACSAQ